MNYLNLTKAVLRRLREDATISNVSDTGYTTLIGDFINEVKREVEDAWNWTQLRGTVQVATTAGNFRYTLTLAGDRYRILQVINDTEDTELRLANYKMLNRWFTQNSQTNSVPMYYGINGQTGDDPNVDLYPIPDKAYLINFNMIIPEPELVNNTDELTVPDYPVILGTYARALSERGEDGSTMFAEAQRQYEKALGDAIGLDSLNASGELIWQVC